MDIRVIAFSVVYRYLARLYGEPMSFVFRHRCCYFSNLDGHKRRFLPVDCSFSSEIHVNRLKMHVDLIDKGNKITESTLHFHPGRLVSILSKPTLYQSSIIKIFRFNSKMLLILPRGLKHNNFSKEESTYSLKLTQTKR